MISKLDKKSWFELMRLKFLTLFFLYACCVYAQDTFSIVAVDTLTGEVGSAGASCVDLTATTLSPDFIGQLIPGLGAINTQAYYQPLNQQHAGEQLELGNTPQETVRWLIANDCQNKPTIRQYGIAALVNGKAMVGAYTGNDCMAWKGQKLGRNYAIQGNILLGPQVLDSMEYHFLKTEGSLAEKLMAALQGAKVPGADKRCLNAGISSHFAYIKVAKPGDMASNPYLSLGLKTGPKSGIEPIDSLQKLFDEWLLSSTQSQTSNWDGYVNIRQDPSIKGEVIMEYHSQSTSQLENKVFDNAGKMVAQFTVNDGKNYRLNLPPGVYYLEVIAENRKPLLKKFAVIE